MRLSKDLVAASATPLVLSILRSGDSYGYEIIKIVRERSGDQLDWKEGMLYPLLHRLEQNGLVESYHKPSSAGRPRKYYRLLPAGERQLVADRQGFAAIFDVLTSFDSPLSNPPLSNPPLSDGPLGGAHV